MKPILPTHISTAPLFSSALALATVLTPALLSAADGTWTANAAANWSDTTRWSGGIVADGADFTAFFTANITGNHTVTVDSVRTIGNITFTDSTTSSNNLTIGGANALTLDVTSGVSTVDVTQSGRTLTISAPVTVNDGLNKAGAGSLTFGGPITLGASQTWTNNSTGALNTGNGTNLITNGGFNLTFDGTGTINLGTINNSGVTLSGSGNLIKNGTGRVNVGGLNSGFTGTVSVNSGVLHVYNDANALGSGNLSLNGGVLSFYWGVTYTRTLGTGANQVQILGGESGFAGSGTTGPTINLGSSVVWGALGEGSATGYFNPGKFVLGDAGTGNAAATTFSSAIDLNSATRTILVPPGTNAGRNRSTISGRIFGTGDLVKEGAGWLFLTQGYSGTNVGWNGSTTVSQGMLDFTNANMANIGGGSGRNITVAAGSGVRFNALSNSILNRLVETTAEITVMTGTTGNSFDFSSSSGANLPNAFLGNFATNGAKMEYSGTLTPASDNYRLGSPSYNSGLLGMTNAAAMTGTQGLVIGGGSVQLVGAKTFSGDTLIRSGARLGLAAFTGGSEALGLQNSALDVGSTGGNFWLHNSSATGPIAGSANTTSAVFGGLKGSRNLISVYSTTTGANNSAAQAVTAITGFTLNVGDENIFTYTGAIGGFGTGASGGVGGAMTLTKTGLGTQILSGANTYTGGTTISAGTLQFGKTNSMPATGAVSVQTGATIAVNVGGAGEFTNSTSGAGSLGGLLAGVGGQGAAVNYSGNVAVGIDTTNAGGSFAYSGTVADVGTTLALVKTGSGNLTLSGTNTYSGGTTVKGGSLTATNTASFGTGTITLSTGATVDLANLNIANPIVNNGGTITGASNASINQTDGSLTGTVAGGSTLSGTIAGSFSPVGSIGGSFTSTGTLGGTATFAGAVTIQGIHAPGNSPGIETFSAGITYGASSTLEWEFINNTLGTRGTDYDGVDVTGGDLTIVSGASLKLIAGSVDYSTVNWDSTRNFTIVDHSGGGSSTGNFSLDTSSAGSFGAEGGWSVLNNGADIVLTWTPVPEPSTYAALAGLAALGLAWQRRRKGTAPISHP